MSHPYAQDEYEQLAEEAKHELDIAHAVELERERVLSAWERSLKRLRAGPPGAHRAYAREAIISAIHHGCAIGREKITDDDLAAAAHYIGADSASQTLNLAKHFAAARLFAERAEREREVAGLEQLAKSFLLEADERDEDDQPGEADTPRAIVGDIRKHVETIRSAP